MTDEAKTTTEASDDIWAYKPELLPEHLRWKGDGPPPRRWHYHDERGNVTIVYRSIGDFYDD